MPDPTPTTPRRRRSLRELLAAADRWWRIAARARELDAASPEFDGIPDTDDEVEESALHCMWLAMQRQAAPLTATHGAPAGAAPPGSPRTLLSWPELRSLVADPDMVHALDTADAVGLDCLSYEVSVGRAGVRVVLVRYANAWAQLVEIAPDRVTGFTAGTTQEQCATSDRARVADLLARAAHVAPRDPGMAAGLADFVASFDGL